MLNLRVLVDQFAQDRVVVEHGQELGLHLSQLLRRNALLRDGLVDVQRSNLGLLARVEGQLRGLGGDLFDAVVPVVVGKWQMFNKILAWTKRAR